MGSMKEFFSFLSLCFDRTISERGFRQLLWLSVAVAVVFCILLGVSYLIPFAENVDD